MRYLGAVGTNTLLLFTHRYQAVKHPVNIIFIFLIISLVSCGESEPEPDVSFSLRSTITNYEYDVEVLTVGEGQASHLVFVLDPADLLGIAVEEFKSLDARPSAVFVAVKAKDGNKRVRDYTPTQNGEESGMADEFYTFIKSEVMNELAAKNLAGPSSRKMLIGHSIGGLSASWAFCAHNDFFDDYIVLSPALFWDDFSFFEIENELRTAISSQSAKIFIGAGKNEDFGINNGYQQWTQILRQYYPNVKVESTLINGSHYGSRKELLRRGFNFLLK